MTLGLLIVGIFLFSFVFILIIYKLQNRTSSLGSIEYFCENQICSKFDEHEVSIDEACKNFEMLGL